MVPLALYPFFCSGPWRGFFATKIFTRLCVGSWSGQGEDWDLSRTRSPPCQCVCIWAVWGLCGGTTFGLTSFLQPFHTPVARQMTSCMHPEVHGGGGASVQLKGDFDEAQLDSPEFVRRDLQKKLGSLSVRVGWNYLMSHPTPPRLHVILLSSSLLQASPWLLALPPHLGQSMLSVDFSCRLRPPLCVPIFNEGSICPCCSDPRDRRGGGGGIMRSV